MCLSLKSTITITEKVQVMTNEEKVAFAGQWNNLFRIPRANACSKEIQIRDIRNKLDEEGLLGKKNKKPFSWIKQWGYGHAAYFFDYIDPVLQKPVVQEFRKIFKKAEKLPSGDPQYKDPFDYKKLIAKNGAHLKKKLMERMKLFTKNFNQNIYNASLNAVQVRGAMMKWKWYMDPVTPDYTKRFVMKYDTNYDGRLNKREFILASIWHNKQVIGSPSPICNQCYFEVGKTIDAIFLYLDCDNDGYVTAEEIWAGLPNLNRNTLAFNMFAFGNNENIRTAALNDFVLKHARAKDGYLSRREFRVGILLGYWDRQTTELKIHKGDNRTMKKLRWSKDNMVDVALYNYYKKRITKEASSNKVY